MDDVILKAENISKQYRLGLVGTGSLADDINRWWHKIRGNEDPYLKIGEANDRSVKGVSEYIWALKGINFEVQRGEVLGIIGKNGAGKSTLLKILSKVTSPTTGEIKTKGRIASLLEVGTGFHGEMTGRENIYLNGAILGMTKKEINNKIDEIIDFSGCERYIDTPVKRYSSGMKVRLAFAVAAFLEPEILVVDEVLAVGDDEFQKKAIGKMQDISSGEGRTVLFVSHNMAAVQDLCTRAIMLSNGEIVNNGNVNEVVNYYLNYNHSLKSSVTFETKNNFNASIVGFNLLDENYVESAKFNSGDTMVFNLTLNINKPIRNPIISLRLSNTSNINIVTWRSNDFIDSPLKFNDNRNILVSIVCSDFYLLDDQYYLSMSLLDGKQLLDYKTEFLQFEVLPSRPNDKYYTLTKKKSSNSVLFQPVNWSVKEI